MEQAQEAVFNIELTETQLNTLKATIFNSTFSGRDLNNINSLVAAVNDGINKKAATGPQEWGMPQAPEEVPEG